MAKVIAFANQKGGVGKTTSALNVTAALVERGCRALLIDLDASSHSLTTALQVDAASLPHTVYDAIISRDVPLASAIVQVRPGIDLAPATRALTGANVELMAVMNREHVLARKLGPLHHHYDYITIDCGPDLGQLTINALTAAQEVLIPCECKYLALKGMEELLLTVKDVQTYTNPDLRIVGILPTMFDSRTLHRREALEELHTLYNGLVLDPPISDRTAVSDAVIAGKTIFEYDNRSDAAAQYRHVAEVILNG